MTKNKRPSQPSNHEGDLEFLKTVNLDLDADDLKQLGEDLGLTEGDIADISRNSSENSNPKKRPKRQKR